MGMMTTRLVLITPCRDRHRLRLCGSFDVPLTPARRDQVTTAPQRSNVHTHPQQGHVVIGER
jgi:hypothetical protein